VPPGSASPDPTRARERHRRGLILEFGSVAEAVVPLAEWQAALRAALVEAARLDALTVTA
jgi:hypothetical protein